METAKSKRLAVLSGDGIGPEIVEATVAVVQAAARKVDLVLDLVRADVGWVPYRASGSTLPGETLDVLNECAGWIVGPTAAGDYPKDDPVNGHPSGYLRRNYELFGNVRPVHAWPALPALVPSLATTVIRENTEGFYPDRNMHWGYGEFMPTEDVGISLRVITRRACDRLARLAFEYAALKGIDHLVVVHKRTALPRTDGLFIAAFEAIRDEYPAVSLEMMRIDTFSSSVMFEPERFALVATTNMFGDIISDQVSGLVGGVGLAPSLNAGAEHAMAQAVHGTAEDIAGKGIANPTALMLSAALLLEWLGMRDDDKSCVEAAALLTRSVGGVLGTDVRTRDLVGRHLGRTSKAAFVGGSATTADFTDAVVAAIGADQAGPGNGGGRDGADR